MRVYLFLLTILSFVVLGGCTPQVTTDVNRHQNFVIGISPCSTEKFQEEIERFIVTFMVNVMGPGCSLTVVDAQNPTIVTSYKIPNSSGYLNQNARLQLVKEPLIRIKQFYEQKKNLVNNEVAFPKFVEFVANYIKEESAPLSVTLIGNLLRHQAFPTLAEGFYPSDAYILLQPSQHAWGLRPGSLSGIDIHLAHVGGTDSFVNEIHLHMIERFFSLYISQNGGLLYSFLPNFSDQVLLDRIIHRNLKQIQPHQINSRPGEVPELRAVVDPIVFTDPVENEVTISLVWEEPNIDLDLHLWREEDDNDVLFFSHEETGWALLKKEYTVTAPSGFEHCFLKKTNNDFVKKLHGAINFFAGHVAESITFTIRVQKAQKVFEKKSTIVVSHGNYGKGFRDEHNPNWFYFDMSEMVDQLDQSDETTSSVMAS